MIYKIVLTFVIFLFINISAQNENKKFWQKNTLLTPIRIPLPDLDTQIKNIDLDNDGDPDVLQTVINGFPVQWIDDDDDLKSGEIEGDIDNDCLMIDRNKDGFYGGEFDLIIDWNDENGDSKSDIQVIVDYSGFDDRERWKSHYWWFIDNDKDQVLNFINWNTMQLEGWELIGRSKFFPDYHGKSTFLKVHTNTFNIADLRYNWENPFLFYDPDNDGQTEMALRYLDEPLIKTQPPINKNQNINEIESSINFTKKISSISLGIDLDNDSSPGNELDFDMSLKFAGEGFDYSDQVHNYKSLRGLPEADKFFYDPRWRQLEELIFTNHENGYKFIFERSNWKQCWFVFDEDDDCHRWERVEFYSPKNLFKVGAKNGGLDDNPQADVSGDRGEWDLDFSGEGKLYIGKFDGLIHLYGAEWGAWRIDQNAKYYQGWQGWRGENLQPEDLVDKEPEIFPAIKYTDTDNNGYFDLIKNDLNGDTIFEININLSDLEIIDSTETINIERFEYQDFTILYENVALKLWNKAERFISLANSNGLSTLHYSAYLHPNSIREKYHYGYWLSFYLYNDLKYLSELKKDSKLSRMLDLEYYSYPYRKTYARFVPERLDDFAWENDRIAFRMYGPALEAKGEISNGIDVWVKSTEELIIDKWYKYDDYHTNHGEGLDYYKVGPSLGAGGSALWENDKLNKSNNFVEWEIIENGPSRVEFKLNYASRKYKATEVTEIKTISLEEGSNLNKVKVYYEPQNDTVSFENVIGIVKHQGEDIGTISVDEENGIISYWEPTNLEHGNTGIGVIINPNELNKVIETPEHFLILLNSTDDKSFTYYSGACWSKNKEFPNYESWKSYLQKYYKNNVMHN